MFCSFSATVISAPELGQQLSDFRIAHRGRRPIDVDDRNFARFQVGRELPQADIDDADFRAQQSVRRAAWCGVAAFGRNRHLHPTLGNQKVTGPAPCLVCEARGINGNFALFRIAAYRRSAVPSSIGIVLANRRNSPRFN
ncbi:MAG: hypothetical protein KGQ47_06500 [Hyphomicrobiales bacterium]|nr:hypothetical protein [Hyphomicrobiales bacterium]